MSNSIFSSSVLASEINSSSEVVKDSHRSSNLDKSGSAMMVEAYLVPNPNFIKKGIRKDPEGYSPNAWRGTNCPDRYLPVKEVAACLRKFIREDAELNACKWSITSDSYSGGQSLTVALMAAPFEAIAESWKESHPAAREDGYTQNGDHPAAVTPEAFRLIEKVKAFTLSFNYDDSDGMVDYFDRGFYDRYHIGKWNKPFEIIVPKESSKAIAKPVETTPAVTLEIIDYSEKAIAVIGNTAEVKDKLKSLGGKFNARLKCGAGWIFSKARETQVREAFGI